MAAVVARPFVADAALEIELGLFGHKQGAAATRAVRSAELFNCGAERGFLGVAGRQDAHRRFSSTHPLRSPIFTRERLPYCARYVALLRQLRETLVAAVTVLQCSAADGHVSHEGRSAALVRERALRYPRRILYRITSRSR